MTPRDPSRTAFATALLRALHRIVDEAPPVFDDAPAAHFLPDYQQRFLRRLAALPKAWLPLFRQRRDGLTRMRSQVVVRSRYAEDALADARRSGAGRSGAGRYLILSAGLDSFGLRQADATDPIPVLEIDHPNTQAWKRERVQALRSSVPQLRYLPVDFERQSLDDALPEHPEPQFISWLGTTYYLSRAAITATLTQLARRSVPGSRLVLDYWSDRTPLSLDTPLLAGTRIATAWQQEPMRSFFDPEDITRLARECGWRVHEHCPPAEQNRRYLQGRRDGLEVPAFAFLLHLER